MINNNMPYNFKFTKELEQFGLCSYKLTLTDSDSILPELNMPVIFKQGENTEDNMKNLAERVISQRPLVLVEEPIVEEPIVEEPIVEEQI